MVEMINRITNTHMWVNPDRVAEYANKGHQRVEEAFMNEPIAPPLPIEETDEKPARGRAGRGGRSNARK